MTKSGSETPAQPSSGASPRDGAPVWQPDTLAVSLGRPPREPGAGVNTAIELSSTFHADGPQAYARDGNTMWSAFEEVVAALEGADHGVAYASGMAAINAVLDLVPIGGIVVASRHPYAATRARLLKLVESGRLAVRWVDITDADATAAAMAGAHLALLESPTNPLLEICDLRAAARSAREHGVMSVVDNTFSTPLGQRPLSLGVDVALHSATKFLAGHADALMGIVVTSDTATVDRLRNERSLRGAVPGPFETFLALRGTRTLGVRVERATQNAAALTERLLTHPDVIEVRYPGLPDTPGYAIARQQMLGFGAIIGIRVAGGGAVAEAVSNNVQLWSHATSLGGVESLIERRARLLFEHPDVPADLLRLSVGIEAVDDLWADLSAALSSAARDA